MTLVEKVEDYLRHNGPATRQELAQALVAGNRRRITTPVRTLVYEGVVGQLPSEGAGVVFYRGPYKG